MQGISVCWFRCSSRFRTAPHPAHSVSTSQTDATSGRSAFLQPLQVSPAGSSQSPQHSKGWQLFFAWGPLFGAEQRKKGSWCPQVQVQAQRSLCGQHPMLRVCVCAWACVCACVQVCICVQVCGLPRWHSGKESTCQCRRHKRHGFDPWVKKVPCRRKHQFTAVFLPGKFHGQRSPAGYSPWGHKEPDHSHKNILAVITGKYIKYKQRNMEFILVICSHILYLEKFWLISKTLI